MKRIIKTSKYGIHFIVKSIGGVTAYWTDLIGISPFNYKYNKKYLKYIKNFWVNILEGIMLIIKGRFF